MQNIVTVALARSNMHAQQQGVASRADALLGPIDTMAMRLYTCDQLTAPTHSDSRLANKVLTAKPALAGA